jgi:alkaline phosphatase
MLDIDDSVQEIMDWIDANGGYEKNALYVTADHDHYLTLLPHFPEVVANMIIDGISHNITPGSNTNTNAWSEAIGAGRHNDDSKSQTEHLKDFSTWTDQEIQVSSSLIHTLPSTSNRIIAQSCTFLLQHFIHRMWPISSAQQDLEVTDGGVTLLVPLLLTVVGMEDASMPW